MEYYNFPSIKRGDTFDGILFTVKVNGLVLDLTSADINMDLRITPLGEIIKHFGLGTGFTLATNPATGVFSFDEWTATVDAANYYYDIEITLGNGEIHTYIGGRWNIAQDITYT